MQGEGLSAQRYWLQVIVCLDSPDQEVSGRGYWPVPLHRGDWYQTSLLALSILRSVLTWSDRELDRLGGTHVESIVSIVPGYMTQEESRNTMQRYSERPPDDPDQLRTVREPKGGCFHEPSSN